MEYHKHMDVVWIASQSGYGDQVRSKADVLFKMSIVDCVARKPLFRNVLNFAPSKCYDFTNVN